MKSVYGGIFRKLLTSAFCTYGMLLHQHLLKCTSAKPASVQEVRPAEGTALCLLGLETSSRPDEDSFLGEMLNGPPDWG